VTRPGLAVVSRARQGAAGRAGPERAEWRAEARSERAAQRIRPRAVSRWPDAGGLPRPLAFYPRRESRRATELLRGAPDGGDLEPDVRSAVADAPTRRQGVHDRYEPRSADTGDARGRGLGARVGSSNIAGSVRPRSYLRRRQTQPLRCQMRLMGRPDAPGGHRAHGGAAPLDRWAAAHGGAATRRTPLRSATRPRLRPGRGRSGLAWRPPVDERLCARCTHTVPLTRRAAQARRSRRRRGLRLVACAALELSPRADSRSHYCCPCKAALVADSPRLALPPATGAPDCRLRECCCARQAAVGRDFAATLRVSAVPADDVYGLPLSGPSIGGAALRISSATATASWRERTFSLRRMFFICERMVSGESTSSPAI
jgi:hypothetical protein